MKSISGTMWSFMVDNCSGKATREYNSKGEWVTPREQEVILSPERRQPHTDQYEMKGNKVRRNMNTMKGK